MHLILRRSHRSGLLGGGVIYALDMAAHLTKTERVNVTKHGLANTCLYQRLEVADRGRGLLGLAFRRTFMAANLTVTVHDLMNGKRVEFTDIREILALEDQIMDASRTFNRVLIAAAHFDGEEVWDL